MRRFVLLLLLCVLPLQFALAASVDAREHAGGGHTQESISHLHSYEDVADAADDSSNADDSSSRLHGECGACHFFHSLALLETRAELKRATRVVSLVPSGRDAHHRSAAAERPERPNWSALV